MFKGTAIAWCAIWGGLILQGCSSPEAAPELENELPEEISRKMSAQELAWSNGDPGGFMAGAYWPSDSLVFVGAKGLTYGYKQVLENYKRSYPDPAAMGKLTFKNLSWKLLPPDHGLLIGEWHLQRDSSLGPLSGHYSLIWERQPVQGWVIIADHSS
jgi:hypothetical protein